MSQFLKHNIAISPLQRAQQPPTATNFYLHNQHRLNNNNASSQQYQQIQHQNQQSPRQIDSADFSTSQNQQDCPMETETSNSNQQQINAQSSYPSSLNSLPSQGTIIITHHNNQNQNQQHGQNTQQQMMQSQQLLFARQQMLDGSVQGEQISRAGTAALPSQNHSTNTAFATNYTFQEGNNNQSAAQGGQVDSGVHNNQQQLAQQHRVVGHPLNAVKNNQSGAGQFFSENSHDEQSFGNDNRNLFYENQKRRISIANQDNTKMIVSNTDSRSNHFMGSAEEVQQEQTHRDRDQMQGQLNIYESFEDQRGPFEKSSEPNSGNVLNFGGGHHGVSGVNGGQNNQQYEPTNTQKPFVFESSEENDRSNARLQQLFDEPFLKEFNMYLQVSQQGKTTNPEDSAGQNIGNSNQKFSTKPNHQQVPSTEMLSSAQKIAGLGSSTHQQSNQAFCSNPMQNQAQQEEECTRQNQQIRSSQRKASEQLDQMRVEMDRSQQMLSNMTLDEKVLRDVNFCMNPLDINYSVAMGGGKYQSTSFAGAIGSTHHTDLQNNTANNTASTQQTTQNNQNQILQQQNNAVLQQIQLQHRQQLHQRKVCTPNQQQMLPTSGYKHLQNDSHLPPQCADLKVPMRFNSYPIVSQNQAAVTSCEDIVDLSAGIQQVDKTNVRVGGADDNYNQDGELNFAARQQQQRVASGRGRANSGSNPPANLENKTTGSPILAKYSKRQDMKIERIKQEFDDREMSHDASLLQGNKTRGRKGSFQSNDHTTNLLQSQQGKANNSRRGSVASKNQRLSQLKLSQKRTSNSVNDNCSMHSCGLSSSNKWSTSSKSKKIKKGDRKTTTRKVYSNANKKVSQFKKAQNHRTGQESEDCSGDDSMNGSLEDVILQQDQDSAELYRQAGQGKLERQIGPLTEGERLYRVMRYFTKKRNKMFMKKFSYTCRKQVAEKRLRIKGRFVTKEQAFEILGLTQDELLDNVQIQDMLTQHAEGSLQQVNSFIQNNRNGGQLIKVRNFQALIGKAFQERASSQGSGSNTPRSFASEEKDTVPVIDVKTHPRKSQFAAPAQEMFSSRLTKKNLDIAEAQHHASSQQKARSKNSDKSALKNNHNGGLPFRQNSQSSSSCLSNNNLSGSKQGSGSANSSYNQMLVISSNSGVSSGGSNLKVIQNYVQPVFKITKDHSHKTSSSGTGSIKNCKSNSEEGCEAGVEDQSMASGTEQQAPLSPSVIV